MGEQYHSFNFHILFHSNERYSVLYSHQISSHPALFPGHNLFRKERKCHPCDPKTIKRVSCRLLFHRHSTPLKSFPRTPTKKEDHIHIIPRPERPKGNIHNESIKPQPLRNPSREHPQPNTTRQRLKSTSSESPDSRPQTHP
jgi:hypothetical protein